MSTIPASDNPGDVVRLLLAGFCVVVDQDAGGVKTGGTSLHHCAGLLHRRTGLRIRYLKFHRGYLVVDHALQRGTYFIQQGIHPGIKDLLV